MAEASAGASLSSTISIATEFSGTTMGSLEHRYLMAQCDVFVLQCSLATKAGKKGTDRY